MYAYFASILNKPVSDDNFLYRGDAHVDTRAYATYGQLEWDWTEQTKLAAGLRYSYDDKQGRDNTFVQFVGDPDSPTVYRKQDDNWDKWTWRLGISYNNTEYGEFLTRDANACTLGPLARGNSLAPLCTEEQDLNGNEFALTPRNKVSLNATYFWAMFELDWSATLSDFYTGEQWMTPFNDPLYDEVGSWDRWDARLNAITEDGVWEVTAFIKNISDDREVITRGRPSTVTQNAVTVLTDPQVYGLRLDYHF